MAFQQQQAQGQKNRCIPKASRIAQYPQTLCGSTSAQLPWTLQRGREREGHVTYPLLKDALSSEILSLQWKSFLCSRSVLPGSGAQGTALGVKLSVGSMKSKWAVFSALSGEEECYMQGSSIPGSHTHHVHNSSRLKVTHNACQLIEACHTTVT